jgi:hypothetical protein
MSLITIRSLHPFHTPARRWLHRTVRRLLRRNDFDHELGVGKHGDVPAVDLVNGSAHLALLLGYSSSASHLLLLFSMILRISVCCSEIS